MAIVRSSRALRQLSLVALALAATIARGEDNFQFSVEAGAGSSDNIRREASDEQSEDLANLLRQAGAKVDLNWIAGGHGLTREDLELGRRWLGRQ